MPCIAIACLGRAIHAPYLLFADVGGSRRSEASCGASCRIALFLKLNVYIDIRDHGSDGTRSRVRSNLCLSIRTEVVCMHSTCPPPMDVTYWCQPTADTGHSPRTQNPRSSVAITAVIGYCLLKGQRFTPVADAAYREPKRVPSH